MKSIGWICFLLGSLILIQYSGYLFLVRTYNIWIKIGLTLLYSGILLLLLRVFRQQYRESKNDPFKEVQK